MENKFDISLKYVYDLIDYYLAWNDVETVLFNIIVKEKLEPEDVLQFKDTISGLILVTPVVHNDGNVSYTVICINRISHLIHCASTNGDILNCETFSFLCNIKENGQYFSCIQYTNYNHFYQEFVLITIIDDFVNSKQRIYTKELNGNFYFMCRDHMPYCRTYRGYNITQPLNFYVLGLHRYPNMHPKIRKCIENHVKKQMNTLDEKGLQQLSHKDWLEFNWKGLEEEAVEKRKHKIRLFNLL